MSRLGLNYLTSHQFVAYPFKEDALGLARSAPVAHGAAATVPLDFLLDAVIHLDSEYPYLHLYSITASGGTYIFTFRSGATTVAAFNYVPTTAQVVGTQSGVTTIRLLKGASFDSHLATIVGTDVFDDRLMFEDAAVDPRLPRLESLEIYQDLTTPCDTNPGPITEHVRFQAGYNMALELLDSTGDDTTLMEWTAAPGAGKGQRPCDEQPEVETESTRNPDGLNPDADGNVYVQPADTCFSVNVVDDMTIQIAGDCYPCCECEDYLAVAQHLATMIERTDVVRRQLIAQHTLRYSPAVLDYENRHFPYVRDGQLDIKAIRGIAPNAEHQGYVTVTFLNASDLDITGITVTATMTPAGSLVGGSYSMADQTQTAGWPTTNVSWTLPPGVALAFIYHVTSTPPPSAITVKVQYMLRGTLHERIRTKSFEIP